MADEGVRIQYLDDADDPAKARRQAISVVQDPRLVMVIGHSASATTAAAGPIYASAGVPLLAPIATMDQLFTARPTPVAPSIFRLPPANRFQARAIVRHLQQQGVQQVATLYAEDGAYSSSLERQVSEEWAAPGAYVRLDLTQVQPDDSDGLANRLAGEFRRLDLKPDIKRAVVIATYYRDAITGFRAVARLRRILSSDIIAIGSDGALHPGIGLPVGTELLGAHFVFVGPSWQEFDPKQDIFNRYRWVHQQSGHPQRDDQPAFYEAMWPSFISYGYLAGHLARVLINQARAEGAVTKNTLLHLLQTRSFELGLPSARTLGFVSGRDGGVMEPSEFVITVYRVKTVPTARRLDALWLEKVAHYTAESVRQ